VCSSWYNASAGRRLCCNSLAAQVFLKGTKEVKVAEPDAFNHSCEFLRLYGWKIMDSLPYIPALAPGDFRPSEPIKKKLAA
jgi:hypothetical protein